MEAGKQEKKKKKRRIARQEFARQGSRGRGWHASPSQETRSSNDKLVSLRLDYPGCVLEERIRMLISSANSVPRAHDSAIRLTP